MLHGDYFDSIAGETESYWLGFLYADGGVRKRQTQINLARRDASHLQKLSDVFGVPLKPYSVLDKRTGRRYFGNRLTLSSKHLCDRLLSLGITVGRANGGIEATSLHVPSILFRHFVRGMFDGDGHVGRRGATSAVVSFSASYSMLETLKERVVGPLGLRANKILVNGQICALAWSGLWAVHRLESWMYEGATVWLERKRDVFASLPSHRGVSRYAGVSRSTGNGRWVARLFYDGKTRHIGVGGSEEEAARLYDAKALSVYGERANLNFPSIRQELTASAY